MFNIIRFLMLSLFFVLISCSGSDDGTGVVFIPEVGVECLSNLVPQCQSGSSGRPLFIGFTSDLSLNCANLFDSVSISALTPSFEGSGFGVTSFQTTPLPAVTGQVASWRNQLGNSVDILADQEYKFCAMVDVNNDNLLNSGEPFLEQTNLLSDLTQLTLDNWETYPPPFAPSQAGF